MRTKNATRPLLSLLTLGLVAVLAIADLVWAQQTQSRSDATGAQSTPRRGRHNPRRNVARRTSEQGQQEMNQSGQQSQEMAGAVEQTGQQPVIFNVADEPSGEMAGAVEQTGQQSGEMNQQPTTPTRRRRRGQRQPRAASQTTEQTQQQTEQQTETMGQAQTGAQSQAVMPGEQTDLFGTYTGTINFPDGGMSGEATLTIQGNTFTLTSGGTTKTGRITAVTTRGYTAVTMQFDGQATGGQQAPPAMIISLRARRNGDQLTLTSVRGETRQFSFVSGGTAQARRGRGRRGRAAKPAESATPATPAEPGQQSATPAEQATPAQPEQGRATRRNQRRNQRRNVNRNANAPTP